MTATSFSSAWPIIRFGEVDSTNEEARRRAASGDAGPCWLTAKMQTAGRGRLGRQWDSPAGNLFATALFVFPRPPAEAALASYSAGLAVIDAAQSAGIDVSALRLKWPNDVLAGEAKLAGVLIETGMSQGQLWMAAGFGVNVASAPRRADRATACLAQQPGGQGVEADRILAALDIAFRSRLSRLLAEGFGPTRAAWLGKAAHLNTVVSVSGTTGILKGLADDGALILELGDGSQAHVRAGEISLLE